MSAPETAPLPAAPTMPPMDPAFNRLKDCRHGKMLYNYHDIYVGRSLDIYGEYSEAEFHLLDLVISPGDIVVEVGANNGSLTIPMAKKVGNTGGVYAFEPQRIVFQNLCANVSINSLINVWAYNVACGGTTATVKVPLINPSVDNNFGGMSVINQQQGDQIAVIPLDSFGIPRCRLIKVDVEGMELEVLRGARHLIIQNQPALYVENDRRDQSDELISFIENLGYNLYWHRPPLFSTDNFFKNPTNIFGTLISTNMFCVPK
jgi:FkbM family methyltransferase